MDNEKKLYGVDLDSPITPFMARDALIECFFEAHCSDAGIEISDPETAKEYIKKIVEKAFTDSGGNFENPTKESILKAMENLKDFSSNFRNSSIIEKHAAEMMRIVEKIS